MNNLRRMMAGYDIPATAQKITTTNYSDLSGNVIYIPLQSPAASQFNVKRRTLSVPFATNEKIQINGLVADNITQDGSETLSIRIDNPPYYSDPSTHQFGIFLDGVYVNNYNWTVTLTPSAQNNVQIKFLAPEDDQCVYYKIKFTTPRTPTRYGEYNMESNDIVMPFYIDNED